MSDALTQVSLISNVWIKLMTFEKAGDVMKGHTHVFDHPTLLAKGSVEVEVEGKKTKFTSPHIIFIQKGKRHSITALEDNTVAACIHAIRDGDQVGDIIDPSMIPAGTTADNMFNNMPGLKHLAYGLDPEDL